MTAFICKTIRFNNVFLQPHSSKDNNIKPESKSFNQGSPLFPIGGLVVFGKSGSSVSFIKYTHAHLNPIVETRFHLKFKPVATSLRGFLLSSLLKLYLGLHLSPPDQSRSQLQSTKIPRTPP